MDVPASDEAGDIVLRIVAVGEISGSPHSSNVSAE
ncbi:MAG: hypothetical protein L0H76_14605 [Brevibacterium sp.]|nr:hypothetical protein [Brevibacterium sp.]